MSIMTKHENRPPENICPLCGSKQVRMFFEMLDVPVHCNVLWSDQRAARNCPKGDIKLGFCPVCSFIANLAFEPARLEYTQAYDNSLHFSPRFQDYARSLAKLLVERYGLYNRDIIEIGCGKGDFLVLLCEIGNNRGVGFDPAYVEQEQHIEVKDQIKFIQDSYSERYGKIQGDLIVCRQTLEHIHNPKGFLSTLRRAIGDRLKTNVFFEVPNALHTFLRLSVWDIIYEHCSYFTPFSLSLIFSSCGFQVCDLTEEFEGQYLSIHALPASEGVPSSNARVHYEQPHQINQIARGILSFSANYQNKVKTCRNMLERIEARGQRAVVWGAGSKGVTFLNTFKDFQIGYTVDINPNKHDMYIPGTGQRIVPPEFLRDYQPDVIIVMNPIYKREILQLTKKVGLITKFEYA